MRCRAKPIGSALELVHLGSGQLGEQVRRNPDTLSQVQVISSTLKTLLLTQELLREVRLPNPRNQNIGLQAVNPKPVLGTKVAKDIKQLLQQSRAICKQGHIIRVQEDTDRKDGKVRALQPGQSRPVLAQVGADAVDK